MNTTDYFTNINAMFLFCIFTCGLLVWAVIRGYILKGKLLKEQDSHLKATNTNTLLNKALSAKNAGLQANEHKLRDAEKEIRDLQAKLDHAEADRIELRAERATLENKLTDALAKVRKRDKDGKFLPSGNGRVRTVKKVKAVSELDNLKVNEGDELSGDQPMKIEVTEISTPKLIHGLTVKDPTEDEVKMIFDEAMRLGLRVESTLKTSQTFPWIWVAYDGEICSCMSRTCGSQTFVTANEFVQRMQNGRG